MEKKKDFLINICYWVVIIAIAFLFLKYVVVYCVPFIIGFLLAVIALKINKRFFKDNNKYRLISLIIELIIIIVVISCIGLFVYHEVGIAIHQLPEFFTNNISQTIKKANSILQQIELYLPEAFKDVYSSALTGITNSLIDIVKNIGKSIISKAPSFVLGIPNFIISIILVIVSAFNFTKDMETVRNFCHSHLPKKIVEIYENIKEYLQNVFFKVIFSYIKIMGITFVEMFIGFFIIRFNDYSLLKIFLVAIGIAVVDIFPVLGCGTILIPLSVINLIQGNYLVGIEVFVLYIIVTAIRQVIEPKIVGDDLGLHPLVSLSTMLVGLKLFGIVGMITIPLSISFIIYLNKKNNL